jgi:hypothetical protein
MDFAHVDQSKISPEILRFAHHCSHLAGGAAMPKCGSFHPRDVPWLFGCVTTIDVLDGGRDYRFSFCGDLWRVMLNYDMMGWRLSEAEACNRLTTVRPNYDAATGARSPRYRFGRWSWPDGQAIRYERLIVPFANDEGNVAMLALAVHSMEPLGEAFAGNRSGQPTLELECSTPDLCAAPMAA